MRITRLDILKRLRDRFGYSSYLEIGVAGGATFRHIGIADKTGVDPRWRLWYALKPSVRKTTSDRFFAGNRRTFDLIFVDGLHIAAQAWKDVANALAVLNPGGAILMHDCLPSSEAEQRVPRPADQVGWTGDVWRAFLKATQDPTLEAILFEPNRGCGLIRRRTAEAIRSPIPADIEPLEPSLGWPEYDRKKAEWLRIVAAESVFDTIDALGD